MNLDNILPTSKGFGILRRPATKKRTKRKVEFPQDEREIRTVPLPKKGGRLHLPQHKPGEVTVTVILKTAKKFTITSSIISKKYMTLKEACTHLHCGEKTAQKYLMDDDSIRKYEVIIPLMRNPVYIFLREDVERSPHKIETWDETMRKGWYLREEILIMLRCSPKEFPSLISKQIIQPAWKKVRYLHTKSGRRAYRVGKVYKKDEVDALIEYLHRTTRMQRYKDRRKQLNENNLCKDHLSNVARDVRNDIAKL